MKKIVSFLGQRITGVISQFRNEIVCCPDCDIVRLEGILPDLRARGYEESERNPCRRMSLNDLWMVIDTNAFFPQSSQAAQYVCPVPAAHGYAYHSTSQRRNVLPPMAQFTLTKDGAWLIQWKLGAWGHW